MAGLPGLSLSPRAYRDGDTFECCSQYFSSLKPSKAQVLKKPPEFAIADGFAIGYISRDITTKGANGQDTTINIDEIDDGMCASLRRKRPYAYAYAFLWRSTKVSDGSIFFLWMDQTNVGGVLNNFQGTS